MPSRLDLSLETKVPDKSKQTELVKLSTESQVASPQKGGSLFNVFKRMLIVVIF